MPPLYPILTKSICWKDGDRLRGNTMEIIWNIFVSRIFVKEQQATAAGRKKECLIYELLRCHNQILHIDISFLL